MTTTLSLETRLTTIICDILMYLMIRFGSRTKLSCPVDSPLTSKRTLKINPGRSIWYDTSLLLAGFVVS